MSLASGKLLLRAILKQHRSLPALERALGDKYVKEEFRLMAENGREEHVTPFLRSWEGYLHLLRKKRHSGREMRPEESELLSEEQLGKLKQLRDSATGDGMAPSCGESRF
ncbi:unnamed protein product [Chrysoparadoxa australica]